MNVKQRHKGKLSSSALAVFGAAPAFGQPLHVGRPNLGDLRQFFGRLEDIFQRRWLTNGGPYVQEFENRVAGVAEANHAVAVNNATVGLQIALRAAGVTGSVIIPSFSFIATAHALSWIGLRPIFCDVAPGTFHIDPLQIESLIAPDTTAILGVHVWGQPCDIAGLARVAHRNGLKLLFDAAHAFGCSYRGRMVGNFGCGEVFSFHATKFVNAFEGGAICTNDEQLADRARQLRDFGFDSTGHVAGIGTNGKMCEASAAMGLTSLERLDEFVVVNRTNYEHYRRNLHNVPGIELYEVDQQDAHNYQYVVLRVDQAKTGLTRDHLMHVLTAENILARRYFYPGIHRSEPYRNQYPRLTLPETDKLCSQTLLLPTGTAVSPDDISIVCQLIRLALSAADQVRRHVGPAAVAADSVLPTIASVI